MSLVKSLSEAQVAYKLALEKSTLAITNQTPEADKLKAEATKLGEKLKLLRKDFDKTYSKTLDEVIRITGPESGTGSSGDSKTLSDAFTSLFNKEAGLVQTLPPTTRQQEMSVYVDEATGAFRIGEIYHQDPQTYVNLASSSLKQTQELQHLESIMTGTEIKNTTVSDAEAAYLRSKWCVAVSTWSMLKHDFGDSVPDLVTFVKDMNDLGWIDKSNMELKATDKIVNLYAGVNGGKFDRVSLVSESPTSEVVRDRSQRYEALGQFLNEKHPEAITLRVKEDAKGKGHTISLHRNPDGRTYTVVDTAQPTINGTLFDPAKPLESSLGKDDPSNPYYNEKPVKFDYVKK